MYVLLQLTLHALVCIQLLECFCCDLEKETAAQRYVTAATHHSCWPLFPCNVGCRDGVYYQLSFLMGLWGV
jgi:hypothetical protein